MSDYIDGLVEQHEQIKDLLSNVYKYLKNNESKKMFVSKFKELVTLHIKTEDRELYVVLNQEANNNETVRETLFLFAKRWQDVSKYANNYIRKHSTDDFNEDFLEDTGKILSKLKVRMQNEENKLFPEYEKIMSK